MKKFILGLVIGISLSIVSVAFASEFKVVTANFPVMINGKVFESEKPILIIDGSTYMPLKAIGEALGVKVSWNDIKKQVEIGESNLFVVKRVIDGDTFKIDYNGKEESVRLIGVDTPESVHPDKTKNTEFGKEVSEYSKSQIEGKEVRLEFDVQQRDKYGRILAYVYIGDTFYNAELINKGYAQVMTIAPNVAQSDLFVKLQKEARENKVGMWADEFNTVTTSTEGKTDTTTQNNNGLIKGNISSSGEKIYHIPGGQYYNATNAEEYFNTEAEAQAAGYRKSKR